MPETTHEASTNTDALVFLIDVASCATPSYVRGGKDPKFRRQVAREHATMVMSAIDRLLAHANERCDGHVNWSYRVFDSRIAQVHRNRSTVSPNSTVSLPAIEEFRKATLARFSSGSACLSNQTCISETTACAVQNVIPIARTPGATTASACDDKESSRKSQKRPRIILFAAAPQNAADVQCFLGSSSSANQSCDTTDEFGVRFRQCKSMRYMLQELLLNNVQLVWVHAMNRRIEEPKHFSSDILEMFHESLLEHPCVNEFIDLHSLLLDRNIVHFSALASRLLGFHSCNREEQTVFKLPCKNECLIHWVPVDFICPSKSSRRFYDQRILHAEIAGILPPANEFTQYSVACVALVKNSDGDGGYEGNCSSIGGNDSFPGIIRPCSKRSRFPDSVRSRSSWIGSFSGLMVAAVHTGHSILGSVYRRDISASRSELEFSVLIQPLTPLCAIVRRVNASAIVSTSVDPLLPGIVQSHSDPNYLRKRVVAGPKDLPLNSKDVIGSKWSTSQSARFFEAHLSTDNAVARSSPKGETISEQLKFSAKNNNPLAISSALETLSHIDDTGGFDDLRSMLEKTVSNEIRSDMQSNSKNNANGAQLLAQLVQKLDESSLHNDLSKAPQVAIKRSEKAVLIEDSCEVEATCRRFADARTPSTGPVEILPPLHKKRRPHEPFQRDCRFSKRPRTRDMKRVLANATAARFHPVETRRSSGSGLLSLNHERKIQRPLVAKSNSCAPDRRSSPLEDEHLCKFNLGRRLKYSSGVKTSEVSKVNFYSEPSTSLGHILVPETPSGSEQDD